MSLSEVRSSMMSEMNFHHCQLPFIFISQTCASRRDQVCVGGGGVLGGLYKDEYDKTHYTHV
jgi:hypothetical protein